MEDLKELERKYEELGKEIERLKNQQKEYGRLEKGKRYWFTDSFGNKSNEGDFNSKEDDFRYETGNYFNSKEELEDYIEKIKIRTKLERLAIKLNGGEKIDWNNTLTTKYKISYDFERGSFDQETNKCWREQGVIYCYKRNFLEKAIEEIGEDNLKKLFEN